jgi:hypothetical protein
MMDIPGEFSLPTDAFERQRSLLGAHVEAKQRVVSPRRRRRLAVLVAAAVVVIVATASAFAILRDSSDLPFAHGRESRVVEGVRFSFSGPRPEKHSGGFETGWENGPVQRIGGKYRGGSLLITKSLVGGQAADAVIFWTGFRDRTVAVPCERLLGSVVDDGSTAEIAAAVASSLGTTLVKGPMRVTVGGHPAQRVVLRVRHAVGCDPGFFFAWDWEAGGAFWAGPGVGDTIRVWIVDVDGTRLFFGAEMINLAGYHPAVRAELEQDIRKIIRSIRFDSP